MATYFELSDKNQANNKHLFSLNFQSRFFDQAKIARRDAVELEKNIRLLRRRFCFITP
ncbi:hypothetical protein [Vibrio lentus]|uniref:hypothetical protein n=1 Tax=Vibrio lentus TaxID=136468 RepID=UPI00178CEC52|nr:hypothetical protein [Vibrio lentus]MDN3628145.1 hypothetical protein [Vibrio lentus]